MRCWVGDGYGYFGGGIVASWVIMKHHDGEYHGVIAWLRLDDWQLEGARWTVMAALGS